MSRSHSLRSQEGFTLIELSLAIALFGILSALVFKILTTFVNVSASTISRYSNTATAQDLVDVISRQIRLATTSPTQGPAFIAASPSSITFYSNQGGTAPATETISVAPGQCPCTVTQTITIPGGQPVISRTGAAVSTPNLFEFYAAPNGTELTPEPISIGASGASSAQLAEISVVGITATIGSSRLSPPATIDQMINLPNVAFAYQESQDS